MTKAVVSFPGTAIFAQQVAAAFAERGALKAFLTSFVYRPDGLIRKVIGILPAPMRTTAHQEMMRRAVPGVPNDLVECRPFWEVIRTIASRMGGSPTLVDRIWDQASYDFDSYVARTQVQDATLVYAYEYTAHASFRSARNRGVAAILDLPSLDSREFERQLRDERARFHDLKSEHDPYFEAKFEERQARRDEEIELADVIVANSKLTGQSHVAAGADPRKVVVVPYGAPEPIREIRKRPSSEEALRIVWAGSFSIRKGAHYLIEALRIAPGLDRITVDIYGSMGLPPSAVSPVPANLTFHGATTQQTLFAALEEADALIFPTLSDGFGMVVTEALSRGLPVITTDRAGAADLVSHGHNGMLIQAASSAAIADALQWCLDNRTDLHAMRYQALAAAQKWQWADYRQALVTAVSGGLERRGIELPMDVNP
jgi:glycosyltransferase involved in cell wall biosynthesis